MNSSKPRAHKSRVFSMIMYTVVKDVRNKFFGREEKKRLKNDPDSYVRASQSNDPRVFQKRFAREVTHTVS